MFNRYHGACLHLFLACLLQGCNDSERNGRVEDAPRSIVSLAKHLPPDLDKSMNGKLRDTLARSDYPIAYVVAVEITLPSTGLNSAKTALLHLRSVIPEVTRAGYAPSLSLGSRAYYPESTEVIVEYGPLAEIDQVYSIRCDDLMTNDKLLIRNENNSNVLLSGLAIKRVRDAGEIAKKQSSDVLLYLPIEL